MGFVANDGEFGVVQNGKFSQAFSIALRGQSDDLGLRELRRIPGSPVYGRDIFQPPGRIALNQAKRQPQRRLTASIRRKPCKQDR